jgi:ribonuclease E
MTKEMLINTVEGQECRIAIVADAQLEELYMERVSSASHVGNIYKGRITNVEPSIQAAFIDFGLVKNGFLHISDVNPSYFPKNRRSSNESVGRKKGFRDRPPIQDCLRRGQEVVVQLTKEGIGTKGPTMTTYLSIPGRLLVMMPGMSRLGVSRKIEDDQAREKARAILADLKPPPDIGFIVRTAAIERPKREFQRDLNYLLRLWKSVRLRIQNSKAPAEIYQESDLVTRTIRDVYNTDITRIICDNQEVAVKAKEFLDVAMPRTKNIIDLYVGKEGLFQEYGLEQEIEKIYARRLELPSGGSLVFDQAEALVAIDVNSGRFREHSDAETTATKINMEAARQIARQLRLRDLGGVVIVDFIDMREERNRRAVEKVLRDEMRNDRAKAKVLKISNFGIVEMTRQRVRPSLKQSIFRTCPHCEGTALIKNEESQALLVMRNLQRACSNELVAQIEVTVTPSVEHHLSNFERKRISDLETQFGKKIIIKSDPALSGSEVKINCVNSRSSVVAWEQPPKPGPAHAANPPTVSLDQVVPPSPSKLLPDDEDISDDFIDEEEEQQTAAPQAPVAAPAPGPRVSPPPATPAAAHAATGPAVHAVQVPQPPAQQIPPKAPLPTGTAALPAGAPASPAAPGAQAQSALGPDGKKRRRGRRGGRKHRARRERQALAQQQGLPQGAPAAQGAAPAPIRPLAPAATGAAPIAASPAPAPGTMEPLPQPVPSYQRDSRGQAAPPEPSEEDEISEAREMAIEQQDQEEAQQEVQEEVQADVPSEVGQPSEPPPQEEPAPAQSLAASAQQPETPAQAQEAAPEAPAKRRRHRGGRGRGKGKGKGTQQAPSEAGTQASENVTSAQNVQAAQTGQTKNRSQPQKQVRAASPPPPASTVEPVPSAPPKADQVPPPSPETAAPAAPAAGRKTRVRPKKASHRQDKEYYEETLRRQKEAVTKPKDAIPDEEEEDFSTE